MTTQLLSKAQVGDQVLYRDGSTHYITEVFEPDEEGYMCQTSANFYHTFSGELFPEINEPDDEDIVELIPRQSLFEEQLLKWLYDQLGAYAGGYWLPELLIVENNVKELTFDEFTEALRARVLK